LRLLQVLESGALRCSADRVVLRHANHVPASAKAMEFAGQSSQSSVRPNLRLLR
jgi:hypothetical protein